MGAIRLPARSGKRWLVWGAVAILVVACALWVWLRTAGKPQAAEYRQTAKVLRGPMMISITEGGEIEAANSMRVANDLPWPVVIRKVISNKTPYVKKGDLIIQFDCQDLQDAVDRQQVTVSDAESAFTEASENLTLIRKQVDNNIRRSKQKLDDANEALARYIECDGPISIKNAQGDVEVAKRDLVLAQAKLDFKLKVNKDPELNSPYSDNEIKADEINVGKLQLALEKAQSQVLMLQKYEDRKQKRTLQGMVDDAKLTLEQDKVQAKTQVATALAQERSHKAAFAKQSEVLEELVAKKAKLTVLAPQDGLIVYVNASNSRRNNNDVVIDVGEKINPNTLLMIVPDMTTLQVRTKVYEAMVAQVRKGLKKAYIRLDSSPGAAIPGRISDVSILPEPPQWWQPDVKAFTVTVKMDRKVGDLTPGMNAQVEMILDELPSETLSVPIAAVFSEREKHFCWRVKGLGAEKVPVEVGKRSDTHVQITSGLNESDTVLLLLPSDKEKEKKGPADNAAAPG